MMQNCRSPWRRLEGTRCYYCHVQNHCCCHLLPGMYILYIGCCNNTTITILRKVCTSMMYLKRREVHVQQLLLRNSGRRPVVPGRRVAVSQKMLHARGGAQGLPIVGIPVARILRRLNALYQRLSHPRGQQRVLPERFVNPWPQRLRCEPEDGRKQPGNCRGAAISGGDASRFAGQSGVERGREVDLLREDYRPLMKWIDKSRCWGGGGGGGQHTHESGKYLGLPIKAQPTQHNTDFGYYNIRCVKIFSLNPMAKKNAQKQHKSRNGFDPTAAPPPATWQAAEDLLQLTST